jgi:hypothetical protein
MTRTPDRKSRSNNGEAGLTIIEVLVAMTVFIVITGSIFGLLQVAQVSRRSVSNNVQLTKSLRLGLNLIGRDTYNAGLGYPLDENTVILRDNAIQNLIGVPVDVNTSVDNVPPVIAGNNITLSTFNTTPNTRTDQVTFLFKDVSFNLVGTAPRQVSQTINVNSITAGSGVDDLNLPAGEAAKCRVNDIFLIQGDTSYTLGMVTAVAGNKISFANGDVLGLNNAVSGGQLRSITPKAIVRVKMITYFVTPDGILTRREFGNVPSPGLPATGYVDEPLVYGVEDFQIKYVMDDGSLVDNPSAGPDGIAGNADDDQTVLANIRQVRITIKAKTTELDARGAPVSASQSATFATRNLGYEAN